jgi:hypothetical protein
VDASFRLGLTTKVLSVNYNQNGFVKSAPGVLGTVRSPLHAVVALLRPTDAKLPAPALMASPQLAEAAFRLIYTLALNNQTSEPILRFLR